MDFPIDVIDHDVAVIRATGRLNMLTAARLKRTVLSVLDQGGAKVVLDLSAVEFLDSTGLGAIIAGMKAARIEGGDLRLVAPGPQPSLVLTLSNLDRAIPSYLDVHSAYTRHPLMSEIS
jgi:anti-anti-sigma factor